MMQKENNQENMQRIFYKSHDFGYEDSDGTGLLYLISLDKSVTGK